MSDTSTIVYYSGFSGWQADPEYVLPHGVTIMLSFFRSYDFKKGQHVPEKRITHNLASVKKPKRRRKD
jgi:hypothetical protein